MRTSQRPEEDIVPRVYLSALKQVSDVLYVVDQGVGAGAPNRREDVLLVQLLLRGLTTPGGGEAPYLPPGQPLIRVDGACGAQTITYIKFFTAENSRRFNGAPRSHDGRVDPIVPGQATGSLSGVIYTILALNITYATMRGAQTHNDLRKDPNFPPDLKKHLYA